MIAPVMGEGGMVSSRKQHNQKSSQYRDSYKTKKNHKRGDVLCQLGIIKSDDR